MRRAERRERGASALGSNVSREGIDIVGQLTGGSPRHLLEDLTRIGTALAKADRARPEVELYLASGSAIRGRVVSVADDRTGAIAPGSVSDRPAGDRAGGAIAIVLIGGSAKQPSVAFVRVDQIAALIVVDASLLVKAPSIDAPVPSKLELQRQVAARADMLADTFGRKIAIELVASDLDDEGRRAIGIALPVIIEVLTAVATDELGKEALVSIDTLELGAAGSADVQLASKRLAIRAPKLLTEQLTHAVLRRVIEKLL